MDEPAVLEHVVDVAAGTAVDCAFEGSQPASTEQAEQEHARKRARALARLKVRAVTAGPELAAVIQDFLTVMGY
jgi:hypothetical protein